MFVVDPDTCTTRNAWLTQQMLRAYRLRINYLFLEPSYSKRPMYKGSGVSGVIRWRTLEAHSLCTWTCFTALKRIEQLSVLLHFKSYFCLLHSNLQGPYLQTLAPIRNTSLSLKLTLKMILWKLDILRTCLYDGYLWLVLDKYYRSSRY